MNGKNQKPTSVNLLSGQIERSVRNHWFIYILISAALALQVAFFTGLAHSQDLALAERAANASLQFGQSTSSWGERLANASIELGSLRNFLLLGPTLILYSVLGTSQGASLVFPIVCSALSIGLLYSIALIKLDKSAAQTAAFLWSFFPPLVFLSTASLTTLPIVVLVLFGIYSGLRALQSGKKWFWLLGAVSIAALSRFEPWLATGTGSFLVLMAAKSWRPNHSDAFSWVFAGLSIAVLLISRDGVLKFYELIQGNAEFLLYFPLFLLSVSFAPEAEEARAKNFLLIWAFACLLGFGVKSSLTPRWEMTLLDSGDFLLAIVAPFLILAGSYFSSLLEGRDNGKPFVIMAAIGPFAAFLALGGAREFLPDLDGYRWIGLHSLFQMFSVLSGVVFFCLLLCPLLQQYKDVRWRDRFVALILTGLALSSLAYVWDHHDKYHYKVEAAQLAGDFLSGSPNMQTLYAVSEETRRLVVMSINSGSFSEQPPHEPINVVSSQHLNEIDEGYLLLFEDELVSPPYTWLDLERYGPLGHPRLMLYRLGPIDINEGANFEGLDSLYANARQSGDFCKAYALWLASQKSSTDQPNFILVNPGNECFAKEESHIDLDDLQNSDWREGYLTFTLQPFTDQPHVLNIEQRTTDTVDMRAFSIQIPLEPDSLYYYSVDVMAHSSTAVLYWSYAEQQTYLEMSTYEDWAERAILIATPSWSEPRVVTFSPILFDHLDVVRVRNVYLGRVELLRGD